MLEGKRKPALNFNGFDDYFDAKEMTSIDLGNIIGEASNVSVDLAKVGYWKSIYENEIEELTLKASIREEAVKHEIRKSLVNGMCIVNGISTKYSEKAVEKAYRLDDEWKLTQSSLIKAKKALGELDAIYWGIHSKDRKLDKFLPKMAIDESGNAIEYR